MSNEIEIPVPTLPFLEKNEPFSSLRDFVNDCYSNFNTNLPSEVSHKTIQRLEGQFRDLYNVSRKRPDWSKGLKDTIKRSLAHISSLAGITKYAPSKRHSSDFYYTLLDLEETLEILVMYADNELL